jgi:glycosyltransferase involved in cell wall biosynthesis
VASEFFTWTLNSGKQSACSWYRIMVPFLELRDQGLANVYEDNNEGSAEQSKMALLHSDIGHFYAVQGEEQLHDLRSLKKIKPGRRKLPDGTIKEIFPPALIWDCDDNSDFVHPFNQVFVHQGVRGYPDARLLKPGEGLEVKDAKGNTIGGWVDQETEYNGIKFDVERNLKNMMIRHTIMREMHGVTCASPTLAKYVREVVGQKNAYFFPNTISPRHYEKIRAVRTDKRVRVLWQGGMSHLIDWYPLRDALKAVCEKYRDKFTFVCFGEYFDWINEVVPPSMFEYHPWVEYPAYRLKRGLLNVDINLAPLANNVFNSCKSAIKWYESSIFEDQPEATLAQRGPVFSEIEDGVTGLLFDTPDEFAQKLGLLIEDEQLRLRLHAAAHKWVLDNRTPEKTIPGLFDFYLETRARQCREIGKPLIQPASMEQIMKLTEPLKR